MTGYLVLENGEIFEGERIGYCSDTACEVVFNTGMAGYIETFTDPSYAGQGIVMTYPLIGNYGVIPEDLESYKVWANAVFVHEIAEFESNFRRKESLNKFLRDYKIPGLTNINTRKLTKILRNSGTMRGYVTSSIDNMDDIMRKIRNYEIGNIVRKVTAPKISYYGKEFEKRIVLIDYGFKHNIVNSFLKRKIGVIVCPSTTSADTIIDMKPDGILLSNGPGDPEMCKDEIKTIEKLSKTNIPILGICLGHQLTALAHGFKTEKLKYGHRGPNHPVKDLKTNKVYITSQNHGYCVNNKSIDSKIAKISHVNLNDNTVEGIEYISENIFTVQFHPEACPGPQDTEYIFEDFINKL